MGVALRAGETFVVGRSSPADVVLEERSLSRGHARLTWEENALRVEDLGSTNGTFVDGERVTKASVEPGSSLRLGGVEARIHVSRFTPSSDASDSEALDAALASELRRGEVFGRSTAVLALRDPTGESDLANLLRPSLRPTDRCVPYAATIALVMLAEVELGGVLAWVDRLRSAAKPVPLVVGAAVGPVCGDDPHALVQGALTALRRATLREVAFAPSKRPRASTRSGDAITDDVVVESPPMRALHATLDRVARTKLPVLVLGETGAGKEHVAKALHERGPRSSKPFRAVNCAALPSSLLESTLFGHEKGAFTGATERAAGLFEQADGGTVFLDEVGELPLPAQAALLRVLETKTLVRVGGTKELEVDVRVVAATHRDLEGMVEAGTFRADLLYRLDALTLEVPPLRERVEDVAPLARLFLARARSQWDTTVVDFDDAALDALCAHDWPGNVRQLKNVVERAAAMAMGSVITVQDLPPELVRAARAEPERVAPVATARSLAERVEAFERQILGEVLSQTGGNQSEAARVLRIPRRTLAHKAKRLGVA